MTKKIYKPELIKEKSSSLPEGFKNYNEKLFSELKNGKGLIKVKLDEEIVIQRISHDLYANWESGIRELINNEVRAINISKKEHGKDAYLEITLDTINKKLIIHGINSLGIDSETFLEVLRFLGRSDNFDSTEVGQFGFGFASYTTLSDTVILETYSLLSGEQFSVVGKSGIGFDILPKPTLETSGTKITIVYEKLKSSEKDIMEAIEEICRYKDIPIYLSLPHDIKEKKTDYFNNNQQVINVLKEAGRYLITGKSLKELLKEQITESFSSWRNDEKKENFDRDYILIEKETKDFQFVGCINRKYESGYGRFNSGTVLLVRTPIKASYDFKLSPYKDFIVNLKNERKYKPTSDRERLKNDCVEKLGVQLKEICVDGLTDFFDFENWKELIENMRNWDFYKQLLQSNYLSSMIPQEKKHMIHMLKNSFKVYINSNPTPINESLEDIIKFSNTGSKVFYSSIKFESEIRYILEHYNPCCVVLTKNFGIMEELGYTDIKTINGLGKSLAKTKISVHTSHIKASGWSNTQTISRTSETTTLDSLLKDCDVFNIVIMKKGISDFLTVLSHNVTSYKVVQLKAKQYEWILKEFEQLKKERKEIGKPLGEKGYDCGILTLEQLFERVENKKYETSNGVLTGKQIFEQPLKVYLHNTDIKETAKYVNVNGFLYVPVNNQENFELLMCLSLKGKTHGRFYNEFSNLFSSGFNEYCYKCNSGNSSIILNNQFKNMAFYLKNRLGENNKKLYYLFEKFSRNTIDARSNISDLEDFKNLLIDYAENKPQEKGESKTCST